MHVFIAQDNLDTLSNHENQLVWIGENIRAQTKRYKIQTPTWLFKKVFFLGIIRTDISRRLNYLREKVSEASPPTP